MTALFIAFVALWIAHALARGPLRPLGHGVKPKTPKPILKDWTRP